MAEKGLLKAQMDGTQAKSGAVITISCQNQVQKRT